MSFDFGVNQSLVEEIFLRWAGNPASVDENWRKFFEGLPPNELPQLTSAGTVPAPVQVAARNGSSGHDAIPAGEDSGAFSLSGLFKLPSTAEVLPPGNIERRRAGSASELQARVAALTNAYRVRGHLYADLDPLKLKVRSSSEEFFLGRYGLDRVDPETVFSSGDLAGPSTQTLGEILRRLENTYTRTIGVEFTFLEDREARTWLQDRMESSENHVSLTKAEKLRILRKLTDAETFERFIETTYQGAKRFSVEGGESVIPLLDLLIERSADLGVEEVVIGMAHRGRLNVMVNIMEMDVRDIFAGFDDENPEMHLGGGDVKYHLGFSLDRQTASGRKVHMTLAFNPSHLEFVNPVVEGRARAKQDRRGDIVSRRSVLPLVIHGDAAFVGQGIVAETLNLSELPAYSTGGTVHVVINNQIGFTTNPEDSRSVRYCTDITRMLRCPVFHVNGDDSEAVAQVTTLAAEYRQRFGKDVVIDLYCYRKHGHNEGDEPRFTQPVMYEVIRTKQTVRDMYAEQLVGQGLVSRDDVKDMEAARQASLQTALLESRKNRHTLVPSSMQGVWGGYVGGLDESVPDADTTLTKEVIFDLIEKLTVTPEGFEPHPTLKRFVLEKQRKVLEGSTIDWGTAENLAMASLLSDGVHIRLTGQDVRRGTFGHRHAVIYDAKTGKRHTRLGHLKASQGKLELYDSPLSEAGVLGFEWGYSLDTPEALVMWEAQFGDFVNGAQVIVDQFISSSEDKWNRLSGLVMLLPHGFEGMGPEHSSARLERFLNLAAEDNIQVVNCTTAAQIFHLLRRQVLRPWRKPLVVMTPKSLLRHPRAVCTLEELTTGSFQRIIPETGDVDAKNVARVLFCSGKVYYDLLAEREARGIKNVAIVRIEQLYPMRVSDLEAAVAPYSKKAEFVWVQEEPANMGAWYSMKARWPSFFPKRELRCVSRDESASPATGSNAAHKLEQAKLVSDSFAGV